MKKRSRRDLSVITFAERVYKAFDFQLGGLKIRFLEMGIRNDSWGIVVYKKGIVTEAEQ